MCIYNEIEREREKNILYICMQGDIIKKYMIEHSYVSEQNIYNTIKKNL